MQLHCLSLVDMLLDFWSRGDRDAVAAHFNEKVREISRRMLLSSDWCLRAYAAMWDERRALSLLNLYHCHFRSRVVTYRLDGRELTVAEFDALRPQFEALWGEPVEFVDAAEPIEIYQHRNRLNSFTAPGSVVVRPKGWNPPPPEESPHEQPVLWVEAPQKSSSSCMTR